MRVVSQDGTIDIPYNEYVIYISKPENSPKYHIVCDTENSRGNYRLLGVYSSKEKTIKALELLRDVYLHTVSPDYQFIRTVFQFPQDDEITV
jgi:hypothetical protein